VVSELYLLGGYASLGNPLPEVVEARENTSPEERFACGCRWCSISRQNVLIVYV
jgi:hypothetical protein